ncbi:FecCD family ABC transporter permease [Bacillus atrophaeus]|uniref:FecCD family ABC transporter permease n=1 Tax=Bacillus atrophaeus TaxID=1452 RepID=UPI001C120E6B|nr:iron ABC transporter permease [Bacillus atrophaeus]MBU5264257.1 iron ABC transporter permease [Bacillus atrophaeus]
MRSVSQQKEGTGRSGRRYALLAAFLIALLLFSFTLSISAGSSYIPMPDIIDAVFHDNGSKLHSIILSIRIPRAIEAAFIGANLGAAGALMQAMTRNALASPGIFGINAGASVAVVLLLVVFPAAVPLHFTMIGAFMGGSASVLAVYAVSSFFNEGQKEIGFALTGIVIQAILASITQMFLIFNEENTETVLFWLAGSLSGSSWEKIAFLIPVSVTALLVAVLLGKTASVLSLGEDVSKALGQKVWFSRVLIGLTVIALAGVSVSVAGPIGFIGLMVPHMVRYMAGADYRVVIPLSALLGASLLLFADISSRFVYFPYETPVGVVTAFIGSPFFIYLARKRKEETDR